MIRAADGLAPSVTERLDGVEVRTSAVTVSVNETDFPPAVRAIVVVPGPCNVIVPVVAPIVATLPSLEVKALAGDRASVYGVEVSEVCHWPKVNVGAVAVSITLDALGVMVMWSSV